MKKIYLACPYSHPDEKVRLGRIEAVNKFAGLLMKKGYIVFSPLSHSHYISEHLDNSLSHEFWLTQDQAFLEWADEIFVFKLNGWERSVGVFYEIGFAHASGKKVTYVLPEE